MRNFFKKKLQKSLPKKKKTISHLSTNKTKKARNPENKMERRNKQRKKQKQEQLKNAYKA